MSTLEIVVQRKVEGAWPVVAVLHTGGDTLPVRDEGVLALDPAALGRDALSPRAYGRQLGDALFAGPVAEAFLQAVTRTPDRVHVLLHVEAPDVQHLRWERLCAPISGAWDFLGLNQRTPFSLYLPSATDRRFPPFGRRDLRALVVAACPRGLEAFELPAFDPVAAAAAARIALGPIPCDVLADNYPGAVGRPTLDEVCARITARRYPILHVVCHGGRGKRKVDGKEVEDNWIYLSKEDGTPHPIGGGDFIRRLARLEGTAGLPHFAFLAACETATPGGREAVAGLAQRMVQEPQLGMPAVLAMTETVTVELANKLAAVFYERLREHGELDLALTQACAGLASREDVTVPALYSRLGGRPLFSDTPGDRALTVDEIRYGLGEVARELKGRAPILEPEFAAADAALRNTLAAEHEELSPSAQAERDAALVRVAGLTLEAVGVGFTEIAFGKTLPPANTVCPFPGLYPFRIAQKDFFFCRERLVDDLAARLTEDNFLAVLGPSGSGKSSLVLAGLLPQLLRGRKSFRFEYLTPGEDPLEFLNMALERPTAPDLLVVDQFEEVFTLCRRPEERVLFANRLAELSREMMVVVTMRADFWGDCTALGTLCGLMQRRQELVGPMTPAEMRTAIQKQAGAVGLQFESGLAGDIVDDICGEPGAMPLLQHALQELWKRRRGRWLTTKKVGVGVAAEYEDPDWVRRSIGATAEEVYQSASPGHQERIRDIFTRLTRLGDGAAEGEGHRYTRRRVKLSELTPAGADPEETKRLVATLAGEGARLLVTGAQKREETVEMAHEALIRHWPRLHRWLEDDRNELLVREGVLAAAADFGNNRAETGVLLHHGSRLAEAERLKTHPSIKLSRLEIGYLDACRSWEDAKRDREIKSAQERARLARRSSTLVILGSVAVIVAVIAGSVAWWSRIRQAQTTEQAKLESDRQAFEINRQGELVKQQENETRIQLEQVKQQKRTAAHLSYVSRIGLIDRLVSSDSIQRATDDLRAIENSRAEAEPLRSFEWGYLWNRSHAQSHNFVSGYTTGVSFGPSGEWVLTVNEDDKLTRWHVPTATPEYDRAAGHTFGQFKGIAAVAYCEKTGEVATAGGADGTVKIWEAKTGKPLRTLKLSTHSYGRHVGVSMRFSDAGDVLAVLLHPDQRGPDGFSTLVGINRTAAVLNAATGEQLFGTPVNTYSSGCVDLTGDGTRLAVGAGRTVTVFDLKEKKLVSTLSLTRGHAARLAFSPDNKTLAAAGTGITLWDVASGKEQDYPEAHRNAITGLRFSRDGQYLASGCRDGSVRLWNAKSLTPIRTLRSHKGAVLDLNFDPGTTRLASAGADGFTNVWDLRTATRPWVTNGNAFAFAPKGDLVVAWDDAQRDGRIVANNASGTVNLVETATWREVASGHFGHGVREAFFDPRGSALVVRSDSAVHLLDARTLNPLGKYPGGSAAFCPHTNNLVIADTAAGRLRVIDPIGGRAVADIPLAGLDRQPPVCGLAHAESIVVGAKDAVHVVSARSWSVTRSVPAQGTVTRLEPSPDGKFLVVAEASGRAALWDTVGWTVKADLGTDKRFVEWNQCDPFTFSQSGDLLAVVSSKDRIDLWDLPSAAPRVQLIGHIGAVESVCFSPDGKRVASGSADRNIKLWNVVTGQEVLSVDSDLGPVKYLRFAPDGRALLTAHWQDEFRRVELWEAATNLEIAVGSLSPPELTAFYAQSKRVRDRLIPEPAGPHEGEFAADNLAKTFVARALVREAFDLALQGAEDPSLERLRAACSLTPGGEEVFNLQSRQMRGAARLTSRKSALGTVTAAQELGPTAQPPERQRARDQLNAILAKDPTFAAALFQRGLQNYHLQDEASAIRDWTRVVEVGEQHRGPFVVGYDQLESAHYNLACLESLRREKSLDPLIKKECLDRAIVHLEKAAAAGFSDVQSLEEDADLASIRGDPRYRSLVERMRKMR